MAALSNAKYSLLPDLDSAPDTYETPELTDDNSTIPTGRARTNSRSSSSTSNSSAYQDLDDNDAAPASEQGISRTRLRPSQARSRFEPALVDARDVDFSDRVGAKRRAYKASSRRRVARRDGVDEYENASGDEGGESARTRLARLQREVEELKADVARDDGREVQGGEEEEGGVNGKGKGGALDGREITALCDALEAIRVRSQHGSPGRRGDNPRDTSARGPAAGSPPIEETAGGMSTDHDQAEQHLLSRASDFDSRLTLLEKVLGVENTILPTNEVPHALLATIKTIQSQVKTLTESTPATLDGMIRRVRTLTQDAERLKESRKSARAAQDALRAAGRDVEGEQPGSDDRAEQNAKINALYGVLPTMEKLSPLLPPLLDRLRSLRTIHADAAVASESLHAVEARQADMDGEIQKWRDGLGKVEQAVKENAAAGKGNAQAVEAWVKQLEERIARIG